MTSEEIMILFPINCPVKQKETRSEGVNLNRRFGNVVGYAYNMFSEPILAIQIFNSFYNNNSDYKQEIILSHTSNWEKIA